MTCADSSKWFRARYSWPDVTNGLAWRGTCRKSLQTVQIVPSVEHQSHFHYSITSITAGDIEETRRPVSGDALRSFLEGEGINPEMMAWASKEATNA